MRVASGVGLLTPAAAPVAFTLEPRLGVALLAVGAATRAVAARQLYPQHSAVDLTLARVVGRDGQPRAGLSVLVSAHDATGAVLPAYADVPMPDVVGTPGMYRVSNAGGAVPANATALCAVIAAGTADAQEVWADIVVGETRGVAALAQLAETPALAPAAYLRHLAGLPPV